MTPLFQIKRGDTKTPLKVALSDDQGPVDLTGATVTFVMSAWSGKRTINNGSAQVVDATNGVAWYVFNPGETDVAGTYRAEFHVSYSDGRYETFPTLGYITVTINDTLR